MKTTIRPLRIVAALAAGLLTTQIALAQDTVEIPCSANAFVNRSGGDTDQNETQTLSSKQMNDNNTRVVYLRFDLTSFLSTHPVNNLTAVNLRLNQKSANAATVTIMG